MTSFCQKMNVFLSPFVSPAFSSPHLFLSGVTTGQEGKCFPLGFSLLPPHCNSIHSLYFNPSHHICPIFYVLRVICMYAPVCVCEWVCVTGCGGYNHPLFGSFRIHVFISQIEVNWKIFTDHIFSTFSSVWNIHILQYASKPGVFFVCVCFWKPWKPYSQRDLMSLVTPSSLQG